MISHSSRGATRSRVTGCAAVIRLNANREETRVLPRPRNTTVWKSVSVSVLAYSPTETGSRSAWCAAGLRPGPGLRSGTANTAPGAKIVVSGLIDRTYSIAARVEL